MSSCKGIAEFSKKGIKWVRSDAAVLPPDDLYIRWGCTANVPAKKVLNTAKAIHEVNDKAAFRLLCAENKLAPPSMLLSQVEENDITWKGLSYPVIVRPEHHAQGRNIYKCDNDAELKAAYHKVNTEGYISNYVDKEAEYRVAVVQGRAVWVAKKTPADPNAIAWNVAQGGRFDNVRWGDWPLKVVRIAIEAFNLSSLDFGGVDVMVGKDGSVGVLEINSAPSLTSPYRQECFAKAFDYIIENGKERIPLVKEKGGYLKFIHPALDVKAKFVG
jgi:glutathione synthase/RimK-type ligase-like ATP-grasp enzyme